MTCTVALIGTLDTKLHELLFFRELLLAAGASSVSLIDVGRSPSTHPAITFTHAQVLSHGPPLPPSSTLSSLPRSEVIKHMSLCTTALLTHLHAQDSIAAAVSAGGSGGTALVAPAMRALPIGFPKLILSTVASGDTGPIVGETDLTLMYSVVDIAGRNALLERIMANAAGAAAGMARAYTAQRKDLTSSSQLASLQENRKKRCRVGITMFGVTTPGVGFARAVLERDFACEVYVFHATGHGGRAMERLVAARELDAVLDLTTTEVCDELMGGNMSAGPARLEAAAQAGIPYVVSVGATDMVNFGPVAMVPEKFRKRKLLEHNETVTLMRTTKDECAHVARFVVDKLRQHNGVAEV